MSALGIRAILPLPVGVTGFRHQRDAELPLCDFESLLRHCHEVARLHEGKVVAEAASDFESVANYERVALQFSDRSVDVILNAHYPLLAFAEPFTSHNLSLAFRDEPGLAAHFCELGNYLPLDSSLLATPISDDATTKLSVAEREQIRYWNPTTLGEVVFNNWD